MCQSAFPGLLASLSVAREPSPELLRGPQSYPGGAGSGCHPAGLLTTSPAWTLWPVEPNGFAEPRVSVRPPPVGTTSLTSWQNLCLLQKGCFTRCLATCSRFAAGENCPDSAALAGPLCGAGVGLLAREEAGGQEGGAVAVRIEDRSHACLGGSPNAQCAWKRVGPV